jgi:hypothetical protein
VTGAGPCSRPRVRRDDPIRKQSFDYHAKLTWDSM